MVLLSAVCVFTNNTRIIFPVNNTRVNIPVAIPHENLGLMVNGADSPGRGSVIIAKWGYSLNLLLL
ncbi:hypothetical protein D3C81_14100 [compost metagenome]|nr:hypothetical protein SOD10_45450 [Serratia plymuthica]CAI0765528.1 Uncharacterised protein [Serratia plymuthica]